MKRVNGGGLDLGLWRMLCKRNQPKAVAQREAFLSSLKCGAAIQEGRETGARQGVTSSGTGATGGSCP